MTRHNDQAWLEHLARYGLTPADRQPTGEGGNAMADRLRQAMRDVSEAEAWFTADLKATRASAQYTAVGIRTRAGKHASRLLNDIGRWTALAEEGKAHAAELAGPMTGPPGGTDAVDEARVVEIRPYLRPLDPLPRRVKLVEAVGRGDRDVVRAALDALDASEGLQLVDQKTAELMRAAWAEWSSPKLVAERAEVLQLVEILLQAVRSLKRTLAAATTSEVGDDDPIRAMALGEPTAAPREPDPLRAMAEGAG